MAEDTYVRVAGRLRATGEFTPGIGWETERRAGHLQADPDYRLELVDGEGSVLAEGGVEVRAPICGGGVVPSVRVVGYVAVRPAGRAVVLRHGEEELYRAELAPERPVVSSVQVDVRDDGTVVARWEASHDRGLRYRLLLVDGQRRAIPITDHFDESEITVRADELPGGLGCRLAVVATDGLRSAAGRSEPFDLPERPPSVVIGSPVDGEVVLPDWPVTLSGQAFDLAGGELPEDGLRWFVDGADAGRGRLGVGGPFEPGEHVVQLAYGDGVAEVTVSVPERTAEQEEWRAVSAGLA